MKNKVSRFLSPDMTAINFSGRDLLSCFFIAVVALIWFGRNLEGEPFFADESADIAQSYYWRLARRGAFHHPDWLHPAAVDHLPIGKYLIGAALRFAGHEEPMTLSWWTQWMLGDFSPPDDRGALRVARLVTVAFASFGCAMIYLLGTSIHGRPAGWIAALLLATSPLYWTLSRRAMHDDTTQALVLATFVAYLASMRRSTRQLNAETTRSRTLSPLLSISSGGISCIPYLLTAGITCGIGMATRLNAIAAMLTLIILTVIMLATSYSCLHRFRQVKQIIVRHIVATVSVGLVATAVFLLVNPYFFAFPMVTDREQLPDGSAFIAGQRWSREAFSELIELREKSTVGRLLHVVNTRHGALTNAMETFPHLALTTTWERILHIGTEGLGRYFAGGYVLHPRQHEGAVTPWWILSTMFVVLGTIVASIVGFMQWQRGWFPRLWLIPSWGLAEIILLCRGLTVDFDRYYLGIVVWGSLAAAIGTTTLQRAGRRLFQIHSNAHSFADIDSRIT